MTEVALDFQGESERLDDNVPKSVLPTQIPKTMTPLDRSVGNYALQKTALPRYLNFNFPILTYECSHDMVLPC